jgi:SAM-dependent methyltransferase
MSVFGGDYASYYDLFYADKDYAAEAAFVGNVIRRHRPNAKSIIEFGCGSARHAVEFARAGFSITGLDRSAAMIERGQSRIAALDPGLRPNIKLVQGDATLVKSGERFDVVVSLFHVVSYQTTNDALAGIFRSARTALVPGGLFVFDFWYGPAVLTEHPQVRVRRVATSDVQVTRISEPVHHINRNIVDVKFTVIAMDQRTDRVQQHTEIHSMRYLFVPEIEFIAAQSGFEVIETGEWLTGIPLHEHSWSGYVAARATAIRS